MKSEQSTEHNQLDTDAQLWVVRLSSGEVTNKTKRDFTSWFATSPAHRAAFQEAMDDWSMIGSIARVAEIDSLIASPTTSTSNRFNLFKLQYLAPAAVLVAAVFVAINPFTDIEPRETVAAAVYQTATGQQRSLKMSDGSTVVLNTKSALREGYTPQSRDLWLDSGEAFFDVAKDSSRPFTVHVDDLTVTAVGTAFNIEQTSSGVNVVVTEGVVRVTDHSGPAGALLVTAGNAVDVSTTGMSTRAIDPMQAEEYTAWINGRLIFRDAPLPAVAQELERYTSRSIKLGSSKAKAARVSGVFRVDEAESLPSALAQALDLNLNDSGEYTYILY